MPLENWAAFAAASAILLVIPGPTILLVVSYALGQGWRTAMPMAVGVAFGDFTAMTLSMLGIGALLAASATVFTCTCGAVVSGNASSGSVRNESTPAIAIAIQAAITAPRRTATRPGFAG